MPQLENCYSYDLTAAALFAGGEILALANPFGEAVIVTKCILDVETPTTGACTCDVGIAANATTSSDTLIDDGDIGVGTGAHVVCSPFGTNGKPAQRWGATQYLTATGSASSAGLVGQVKLQIMRI